MQKNKILALAICAGIALEAFSLADALEDSAGMQYEDTAYSCALFYDKADPFYPTCVKEYEQDKPLTDTVAMQTQGGDGDPLPLNSEADANDPYYFSKVIAYGKKKHGKDFLAGYYPAKDTDRDYCDFLAGGGYDYLLRGSNRADTMQCALYELTAKKGG